MIEGATALGLGSWEAPKKIMYLNVVITTPNFTPATVVKVVFNSYPTQVQRVWFY